MKEQLLIKHAVGGRTFVDSSKQSVSYEVAHEDGQWLFAVNAPKHAGIDEILKWKQELNVFIFRNYEDGRPTLKIWYSVASDTVKYDAAGERLTFTAISCIEYIPNEFGYKL
ncbi:MULTISPECIES: hypothetical protein [unclassified Paenibacillus]|uniref:hypothetical protein n=1 Tax=unclassified Paenibacillus TaxID=185978 RepID=UPI0010474B1E|nr:MULTISPECIES: hypothetical protein [unclassified Paenibacillus]NIK71156.1 hypothetical protein [Paenibacillus sp. BK720]TCM97123.1 hypothetical protein EV294_104336 [Paenibacillus sp. BK033]